MTTTRRYYCNVCRDEIQRDEGLGIHFHANRGGEFQYVPLRDAENHICDACRCRIVAIHKASTEE